MDKILTIKQKRGHKGRAQGYGAIEVRNGLGHTRWIPAYVDGDRMRELNKINKKYRNAPGPRDLQRFRFIAVLRSKRHARKIMKEAWVRVDDYRVGN